MKSIPTAGDGKIPTVYTRWMINHDEKWQAQTDVFNYIIKWNSNLVGTVVQGKAKMEEVAIDTWVWDHLLLKHLDFSRKTKAWYEECQEF